MSLTTGQVLQNRYRVVALLGEGGMGAVYRAWDTRLEKAVALKEMVPQPGLDAATLAHLRAQFRQEALTLGKLSHPHLVPVTDYFEERGNDYLVMAYVEGESLAGRIEREGALPEAQVLVWAGQLLDALAYCHAQGVIHRDIKPQNVVIRPDGNAVLVDFGLVKLWDPSDPHTRTVVRGMGTPEYAPPEQWGAQGHHTDPRSDLYGLGATLYHALTGQAPPTASDRMVYPKQFRTPSELNGRVTPQVDAAISRSMTLAIDDRWTDARAMAHGLTATTKSPDSQAPDPRSRPRETSVHAAVAVRKPPPTENLGISDEEVAGTLAPARTATQRMPEEVEKVRPKRGCVPAWVWITGGVAVVLVGITTLALIVAALNRSAVRERTASPTVTATAAVVSTPGTVGGENDQGDDDGVLRVDRDGREQLDSYRLRLSWQLAQDENVTEDLILIERTTTSDPEAWQSSIDSEGESYKTVFAGGQLWSGYGDSWMVLDPTDAAAEEGALLDYFNISHHWVAGLGEGDYEYVGRETVNGCQTRHFETDYAGNWEALRLGDTDIPSAVDSVVGSFWIADEADLPAFVVRLVLELHGPFRDGADTFLIRQEFTEANQRIVVRPPEVGGLVEEVPLYPDADVQSWSPDDVAFVVAGGVTAGDVHAFYKQALPEAGWALADEPPTSEEMVTSVWVLGGKQLTVQIVPDESDGSIFVFVSREDAGQ